LIFVCPTTGQEVPTGLEMEPETLVDLQHEKVRCPQCRSDHQMSEIRAWIVRLPDLLSDEGLVIA
jgi:hypothetical protein